MAGYCRDCFTGTVQTDVAPTGTEQVVHGRRTYVATPGPDTAPLGTVVILTDAFGWRFPNTRTLADAYACRVPCTVYIPDFMDSKPSLTSLTFPLHLTIAPFPKPHFRVSLTRSPHLTSPTYQPLTPLIPHRQRPPRPHYGPPRLPAPRLRPPPPPPAQTRLVPRAGNPRPGALHGHVSARACAGKDRFFFPRRAHVRRAFFFWRHDS